MTESWSVDSVCVGQRRGGDECACCQLAVKGVQRQAVVADHFEAVDKFVAVFFLFDLLVYKPVEATACGVVFFGFGQGVEVVYKRCYLLLVGKSAFKGVQSVFPFGRNGVDGFKSDATAAAVDPVAQNFVMCEFFLPLYVVPVCNSGTAFGLEVHRH